MDKKIIMMRTATNLTDNKEDSAKSMIQEVKLIQKLKKTEATIKRNILHKLKR